MAVGCRISANLPPLYSQENVADPIAIIKLFDPCGRCTFYVLEASRQPDGDLLLFGFSVSPLGPDCDELGYVSLSQLESVRGPPGCASSAASTSSRLRSPKLEPSHERKELMALGDLLRFSAPIFR